MMNVVVVCLLKLVPIGVLTKQIIDAIQDVVEGMNICSVLYDMATSDERLWRMLGAPHHCSFLEKF